MGFFISTQTSVSSNAWKTLAYCFPSLLWQEVKLCSAGPVVQCILVNQCAGKDGCSPGLKRGWGKDWTTVLHQSHHIHLWCNKQHYWEAWEEVRRPFRLSLAPHHYKLYQTSSSVQCGRMENQWEKIYFQSREWPLATSPWEICSSVLLFVLSEKANLQLLHLAPN